MIKKDISNALWNYIYTNVICLIYVWFRYILIVIPLASDYVVQVELVSAQDYI